MSKLIDHDPLAEADLIMADEFYGRANGKRRPLPQAAAAPREAKPKPTHYKIVCISLYTEDIDRLEALVADLKRRGHTKANKSAVVPHFMSTVPRPCTLPSAISPDHGSRAQAARSPTGNTSRWPFSTR